MNALNRLQISTLRQSAQSPGFSSKIGLSTGSAIAAALLSVSMMAIPTSAKADIFNEKACAAMGGAAGGALGAMSGGDHQNALAVLGGLIGAISGAVICAPPAAPNLNYQDQAKPQAGQRNNWGRQTTYPTEPLNANETVKLQAKVDDIFSYKEKWIQALEGRDRAKYAYHLEVPGSAGARAAEQSFGQSQQGVDQYGNEFRNRLGQFNNVLAMLENSQGKDVSVFRTRAIAFEAIPTDESVTYAMVKKYDARYTNGSSQLRVQTKEPVKLDEIERMPHRKVSQNGN